MFKEPFFLLFEFCIKSIVGKAVRFSVRSSQTAVNYVVAFGYDTTVFKYRLEIVGKHEILFA